LVRKIDRLLESNYQLVSERQERHQRTEQQNKTFNEIREHQFRKLTSKDKNKILNKVGDIKENMVPHYIDKKECPQGLSNAGTNAFFEVPHINYTQK